MQPKEFTSEKKEILSNITEIIREKADNVISTSINENISLEKKAETLVHFPTLQNSLGGSFVYIEFSLKEGFEGDMGMIITKPTVAQIADKMLMGEGDAEFDELEHIDAIQEIVNQILGAASTELTGVFEFYITFTEASGKVMQFSELESMLSEQDLMTQFNMTILDSSDFFVITLSNTFDDILKKVGDFKTNDIETPVQGLNELQQTEIGANMIGDVSSGKDLGLLMDVRLPVTVELGRKKMFIRDILKLTPNRVVELPKLQGEPVDLYVNDKKFATGEVVVVAENFGIRIKSLIKPEERLKDSDAWKDDA